MDLRTIVIVVVVGLGLALGVALFLRRRAPQEVEVLYMRCPGCKRKLKYYARQAGNAGMCSNCKEKLVFPRNGSRS